MPKYPLELSTMPGFAGSSAYYLRYEDPHNDKELVSKEANNYWRNVDLYVGGAEHATGHLIYSRFWNKFLYDYGFVKDDEPYKKLINQGMILGRSNFVYRIKNTNTFVSFGLKDKYETTPIHVDINIVENDVLDIEKFKNWMSDFQTAEFILEDGKYICGVEIEKMSKSFYNVQNPDDLVEKYGADTLRLYEMFLGPIEQSKPWNTSGIEGVHRFLKKFWRLFHNENDEFSVSEDAPSAQELKILHKTIKKIQEDTEKFSFNTAVSTFMIAVNELTDEKCNKRAVLEPLTIILSPYCPFITEELWSFLGHRDSILEQKFPQYEEEFTIDNICTYAVSFNGKTRFTIDLPLEITNQEIETSVLENENSKKWLEGMQIVKVIIVPKKIVNIVVKP
jgi:leucyl-tRNA synthetase